MTAPYLGKPTVQITDDGNAMVIVAKVGRALRRAGYSQKYVEKFRAEALSKDYNHVLQTVMDYAEVE